MTSFDVTHPDDLEITRRVFDAVKAGRQRLVHIEKRFVRKDGTSAWTDVSGA